MPSAPRRVRHLLDDDDHKEASHDHALRGDVTVGHVNLGLGEDLAKLLLDVGDELQVAGAEEDASRH